MSSAVRVAALLGAMLATGTPVAAQHRAPELIAQAMALIQTRQLDSADVLLRAALDTGTVALRDERQTAWVWRAVVAHFRGDDSLTHAFFRRALALDTALAVRGLDDLSPDLERIFAAEKREAFSRALVHTSASVDQPPQRVSGPPVAYPSELLRRPVAGAVRVSFVVDTEGRAEPRSIEVLEAPDSALHEPVKAMVAASQFTPGRHRGRPVRVLMALRVEVRPPRLNATELVRQARALAPQRRTDSALTLLDLALGPLANPTDAERAYALLVRGTVRTAARRDSLAAPDYRAGLAVYDSVTARGTELAPVLVRLADSVRRATRPRVALPPPRVLGAGGEPPVLVSHPPLRYPPEARQLGVSGTVVIEVAVDTAGRVEPGTARVVETTNPIFNAEALRVVRAAVYRPARSAGRPVRLVIQQPVAFME